MTTEFTDQSLKPQSRIQARVKARMSELSLKAREVAKRVDASELYGEFQYGTLRNLITHDYEGKVKPRTTFNIQLVIALSEALECHVSELATDYELSTLRDLPYRRAQWPRALRNSEFEGTPTKVVPLPGRTASVISAYMKQFGPYSYPYFAQSLSHNGYRITGKRLVRAIGPNRDARMTRKYVTYEMCEAAAKVFRGPMGRDHFETEWLIECQDMCPHCKPWILSL